MIPWLFTFKNVHSCLKKFNLASNAILGCHYLICLGANGNWMVSKARKIKIQTLWVNHQIRSPPCESSLDSVQVVHKIFYSYSIHIITFWFEIFGRHQQKRCSSPPDVNCSVCILFKTILVAFIVPNSTTPVSMDDV